MGQIQSNSTFYNTCKMLPNLSLAHFTNVENSENQKFPAVHVIFTGIYIRIFFFFLDPEGKTDSERGQASDDDNLTTGK